MHHLSTICTNAQRQNEGSSKRFHPTLKWCVIVLVLLIYKIVTLHAQSFAEVALSRQSVYVQQSFRVTVTVYTSTWFTAPLEFGHLQIPNAFIIPFEKSVPGVFTINRQQYSGIQFYYIVFPYNPGNYTVPAFEITAHTPPKGSSQAQTITIHTNPKPFEVRDVPERLKEQEDWFVAKDVAIRESWDIPLNNLKVGDVVKRTITIDAKGTLPQFIPDLANKERVDWASSYPQDAILTDTRDSDDANGRSTQTVIYLFDKTGDFTFPPITVAYWNPFSNKMYTQTTKEETVHIADNPNLGILTTLKDSLAATQKPMTAKVEDKGPLRILGMCWYYFAVTVVVGMLLLFLLVRFCIWLYRHLYAQRQKYLTSEPYRFKQFSRSSGSSVSILRSLYTWWDSFTSNPSVLGSLHTDKEEELIPPINHFYQDIYSSEQAANHAEEMKKALATYRDLKQKTTGDEQHPIVTEEQKGWNMS